MTIHYAILPQYADVVNVRSNKDGNCPPAVLTINGGSFDRGGCLL
jgi:hypothetical protein